MLIRSPYVDCGILYLPTQRYAHSHQGTPWIIKEGGIIVADTFLDYLGHIPPPRVEPKTRSHSLQRGFRVLVGDEITTYFGANQQRFYQALDLLELPR